MAGLPVGFTRSSIDIDPGRSLLERRYFVNYLTGSSNFVTGGPSSFVSASIASGTTLVSLRHGTTASNDLYVTHLSLTINVATTGSSGATGGELVWERFNSGTPSGGTVRTVARTDLTESPSQVMDVRDHSASLTMTGVQKTSQLIYYPIPFMINSTAFETCLDDDELVKLQPGDGLALSVLNPGPAVQTWTYTYVIRWFEGV